MNECDQLSEELYYARDEIRKQEKLLEMKQDDWIEACKELNRLKEENEKMREMLKLAKPFMVDGIRNHRDMIEWGKKYKELMGEENKE